MLGARVRKLPISLIAAFVYFIVMAMFNHFNVVAIYTILHSFYLVIGFSFMWRYYETVKIRNTQFLLDGMILGSLIQCVFGISKELGFDLFYQLMTLFDARSVVYETYSHMDGTLQNGNLFGAYLALTIPAYMSRRWSRFLIIIPAYCLFKSDSLLSILSAIAGLIYFNFKDLKKHLYALSAIGMVIFYHTGIYGHDSERFGIWKKSFDLLNLRSFIFGNGPGWFQLQGIKQETAIIALALEEHNEFIAMFNWFGFIGIALLIIPVVKFISRDDKERFFSTILFIAWCNAYGHFNLHQSTTAIIIIVSAVVCVISTRKNYVVNMER